MTRGLTWLNPSEQVGSWLMREQRLYVMSRQDGWHKIGHCYGDARFRAYGVNYSQLAHLRPIELVWSVKVVGHGILTLEHAAHKMLLQKGFVRDGEKKNTEWFNATSDDCIAAIKFVIRQRGQRKRRAAELKRKVSDLVDHKGDPLVTERLIRGTLGKSGRNG